MRVPHTRNPEDPNPPDEGDCYVYPSPGHGEDEDLAAYDGFADTDEYFDAQRAALPHRMSERARKIIAELFPRVTWEEGAL